MVIYGATTAPADYALRIAAGAAANNARKVLPPLVAGVVAAEIGWLKDSTWIANQDRLRLIVAEIEALVAGLGAAA